MSKSSETAVSNSVSELRLHVNHLYLCQNFSSSDNSFLYAWFAATAHLLDAKHGLVWSAFPSPWTQVALLIVSEVNISAQSAKSIHLAATHQNGKKPNAEPF